MLFTQHFSSLCFSGLEVCCYAVVILFTRTTLLQLACLFSRSNFPRLTQRKTNQIHSNPHTHWSKLYCKLSAPTSDNSIFRALYKRGVGKIFRSNRALQNYAKLCLFISPSLMAICQTPSGSFFLRARAASGARVNLKTGPCVTTKSLFTSRIKSFWKRCNDAHHSKGFLIPFFATRPSGRKIPFQWT